MNTTITRTVKINDLNPTELATVFAGMWAEEQAEFFSVIWKIAAEWPGAGWCQQSCEIIAKSGPSGREAIRTLASHLPADDLAYIVAAQVQA